MSIIAGGEESESDSSRLMVGPEVLRLLPELGVIELVSNGKLKPWNWRRHSNAKPSCVVEIPQEVAISVIC